MKRTDKGSRTGEGEGDGPGDGSRIHFKSVAPSPGELGGVRETGWGGLVHAFVDRFGAGSAPRAITVLIVSALILSILALLLTWISIRLVPEAFGLDSRPAPAHTPPRADSDGDLTFFLHPSCIWLNTGIEVQNGQELTFRVSGAVNTAAHRVAAHALVGTKNPFPWYQQPKGPEEHISDLTNRTNNGRIHPTAPFGAILVYVAKDSGEAEALQLEPRAYEREYVSLLRYDKSWLTGEQWRAKRAGRLCFMINDIYLSSREFMTFKGSAAQNFLSILRQLQGLHQQPGTGSDMSRFVAQAKDDEWPIAVAYFYLRYLCSVPESPEALNAHEGQLWDRFDNDDSYYRAFFDENIGGYLISIVSDGSST